MSTADRMADRMARLLEELLVAGTMLSNCAFNLAQDRKQQPQVRNSLNVARMRWDNAQAVYARHQRLHGHATVLTSSEDTTLLDRTFRLAGHGGVALPMTGRELLRAMSRAEDTRTTTPTGGGQP